MPITINNQATANYQFSGSGEMNTITTNVNSVVLEDSQGLSITKTGSPNTFLAGDIITYTIKITNTSASYLTGVRIIDNLGGGNLAYVLGSANLATATQTYPVTPIATNPLTFTLQQLNVGATMTLTYRCQVIFNLPQSVTSITNTVNGIGYTSTGTITGFDNYTIQKKNSLDFSFDKSTSETNVFQNQVFSYRLAFINGSSTSANVTSLTDQLPANFVITSVTLQEGSGSIITLTGDDYDLNATNLFTMPTATGEQIFVPANSTTVITINGYFS